MRDRLGGFLGVCLPAALVLPGTVTVAEQQARPFLRFVVGSDIRAVEPAESIVSNIDTAERRVCLNAGVFVLAAVMAPMTAFDSEDSDLLLAGAHVQPDGAEPLAPTLAQMVLRPESAQGWKSFDVDEPACFEIVVINSRARLYQLGVSVSE